MSRFGAFLGCSLTYAAVKIDSDPSIPYFTVENAERRLTSPRYVYSHNENFRVRSAHRQVGIFVKGTEQQMFYVNPDDLLNLAQGLLKRLQKTRRASNGRIVFLGEINVGVIEFEIMLKLIFDCLSVEEADSVLEVYMPLMLIFSRIFRIRSLGKECEQRVMNADYTKLSYETVESWLEGFKRVERFNSDRTISIMLSEKLILISEREIGEKLGKSAPTSNNESESLGIAEGVSEIYESTSDSKRNR